MTKADAGKLASWRRRLSKFSLSGMSVSEFCRREDISTARFYYWSRRLRQLGTDNMNSSTARHADHQEASSDSVEVFIGDQVRVSIPASNPTLVASVLSSLNTSQSHHSPFQCIELGNGLATRR